MAPGITARELTASALLYPQKIETQREAVFLMRLDQQAYRAASFLDDRIADTGAPVGWVPFAALEAAARQIKPLPLHFIFHAGHVGSTLVSRLLDQVPGVLGLREPLPLRTMATLHDEAGDFARWLRTFLSLWGRGFADTQTVILKATSSTGRLASVWMAPLPQARAIYLSLAAEPYLATLLAGDNSRDDLAGLTAERLSRLQQRLGERLDAERALTIGEAAAVAWLAENLAQADAAKVLGPRLLRVDFDAFLDDVHGTLARIFAHLSLPLDQLGAIAQSPLLNRYSKLPDAHAYSAQLRRQILDQARREQAGEIGLGLQLLERMAARHPAVAALM